MDIDIEATQFLPQPLNDIAIYTIAVILLIGFGNAAWKALRRGQ
ncbi:hypothetical protein [Arthrobacter sp. NicSoilC5]|nr:hypothetical protein [Arthrobacter sp. NicSoilC5]